jgi:ABC-type antimicrobial peptide transport system permease subunit
MANINVSDTYLLLIACDAAVSVTYGIGVMIFLYLRSRNPASNPYTELFDSLLVRVFVWTQIITGSAILGEIVIHNLLKWF